MGIFSGLFSSNNKIKLLEDKPKEIDPKPEEIDPKPEEIDPFDLTLGWEKYQSEEMKSARRENIFAHIREHGAKFIDCFSDFMIEDTDPWHYGNLRITFEGRSFTMYSEEDFIEYLQEAEKTAGIGASKSMKSELYLKGRSIPPPDPELFWLSLHDNYDTICKKLNEKLWSISFIVSTGKTPMLSSVKEFDKYLEANDRPKIRFKCISQTKSVNMYGNTNGECLTGL